MIQQRALWLSREQGFFRRPAEEEFYQGAKCRKRKGAKENKQGSQNKRLQSWLAKNKKYKKSHLLKCRSELASGSGTQNSNDERHPCWDMEVNRLFHAHTQNNVLNASSGSRRRQITPADAFQLDGAVATGRSARSSLDETTSTLFSRGIPRSKKETGSVCKSFLISGGAMAGHLLSLPTVLVWEHLNSLKLRKVLISVC